MGRAQRSPAPAGAITPTGEMALPEIGERVDRHAVPAQLEVQMRPRAGTRAAGLADRIAVVHPLAGHDLRHRQVCVEDRVAVPDVDRDDVPVALVAGEPSPRP